MTASDYEQVYNTTCRVKSTPQPAFTCLKLAIETLEQGVKYVQI